MTGHGLHRDGVTPSAKGARDHLLASVKDQKGAQTNSEQKQSDIKTPSWLHLRNYALLPRLKREQ